jgi:hypothetical protein
MTVAKGCFPQIVFSWKPSDVPSPKKDLTFAPAD